MNDKRMTTLEVGAVRRDQRQLAAPLPINGAQRPTPQARAVVEHIRFPINRVAAEGHRAGQYGW